MAADAAEQWQSDAPGDDLKQIADIGRATAEALHRAGVRTFAALAAETPEQLAERLAQVGLRVSPRRIAGRDWIGQARRRLASDRAPDPPAERQPWHQHAGFSLFFDEVRDGQGASSWQTRLYHEESGDEMLFDGVAISDWANWIVQRADLPAALRPGYPPESPAVSTQPPELDSIHIEMHDIAVRQAVGPGGQPLNRLIAEVSFALVGPGVAALRARGPSYTVEFHIVNLSTNAGQQLAVEQGSLASVGPEAIVHQTEFAIPRPGRYELHTILMLLPHEIRAYYEGPIINVVP